MDFHPNRLNNVERLKTKEKSLIFIIFNVTSVFTIAQQRTTDTIALMTLKFFIIRITRMSFVR